MRVTLAATLVAMLALGPVVAAGLAPASEADLGRALYGNCAACHGDAGQGGFAPAFAANENLKDGRAAIAHVLVGSVNMPPFAEQLSSAEIAAVLNHVRNHWGNRAEPIAAADVTALAKELGTPSGEPRK